MPLSRDTVYAYSNRSVREVDPAIRRGIQRFEHSDQWVFKGFTWVRPDTIERDGFYFTAWFCTGSNE